MKIKIKYHNLDYCHITLNFKSNNKSICTILSETLINYVPFIIKVINPFIYKISFSNLYEVRSIIWYYVTTALTLMEKLIFPRQIMGYKLIWK